MTASDPANSTERTLLRQASSGQERVPAWRSRKKDVHFRLLTLREAAQEFGVHPHAVYDAVRKGRLHPVKPAGRTLYPEWEIRALGRDRDPEQGREGAPYGAVFEGTAAA